MPGIFYHAYLLAILGVILQINGDSSNSDEIVFEYLDNCDPNVDPACKDQLESIRDQLEFELIEDSVDNGSPKIMNTHRNVLVNRKLEMQHNAVLKFNTQNKAAPRNEAAENGLDSNLLKKKSLSVKEDEKGVVEDSGNIPAVYFLIIIIACTLTGVAGIALSGYCWYKLHHDDDKEIKKDYIPGVKKNGGKNSPIKSGDRKLDYKAEMYHYVHTKNQIAAMEKAKTDYLGNEDLSNDEEDDGGEDYTVYECPGLAPTGDMTVVNPLFSDQEVTGSDEGRTQSNRSSPSTPPKSANNDDTSSL